MKGLMLHTGANDISIEQLTDLPYPPNTETYFPIPHIDLVEMVGSALNAVGYSIVEQAYGVAKDRFFGLLGIQSDFNDRRTVIGLRNSHDQSFPIGLASGNQVFVCDNLSFNGEIVIKRRHTRHAQRDLPLLITSAVGKLAAFEESQNTRVSTYKETEITDRQVDLALMAMLRSQVFTGTAIPKVLAEFEAPSHPEFKEDGKTLWRLYNACTELMKNNLWNLPKRSIALHTILDSFGIAPAIELNKDLWRIEA